MDWLIPYLPHFIAGYSILVVAVMSPGPAVALLPVLLVFAAGATVISLIGHGLYAVLLSSTPVRAAYNRARRWIEGALGAFLGVMALRMALERR